MDEKLAILDILSPKAVLQAMTPEAKAAVPHGLIEQGFVRINQFPFKVGRESRIKEIDGKPVRIERMKGADKEPNNDLYLTDARNPMHISREHFQIEQTDTAFLLTDRCSACGTAVGENRTGGQDSGGSIALKDGDVIAIGALDTPYIFKFITL